VIGPLAEELAVDGIPEAVTCRLSSLDRSEASQDPVGPARQFGMAYLDDVFVESLD